MRFSSTSQLWSDSLGEDRDTVLKSIPAKELKRREAVHELVSSEIQYLADITNIIKIFCEPMRKMEIINDEKRAALFSNLTEIVALHTGEWQGDIHIGVIFKIYIYIYMNGRELV